VRCSGMLPRAGYGGASVGGAPSAMSGRSPYPPFAPDGRVDPQLMSRTEPGQAAGPGRAGAAVGFGATVIATLSKLAVIGKFALPLMSALASLGLYAALFGWQFGLGIVVLLFVHEMGHALVIRAKGIPASLPVFIPLLGAAVIMRRMPHNAKDEAEIAIAGPLAGALAGAVCFALYNQTGFHLWLALAYFSFFINLLNLIPVSPLDGGRIAGAISKWIWPVGLVLLTAGFLFTYSIILLLVGWIGLLQTIERFRRASALDAYYRMPASSRIWITVLYFGLAAMLALGMLDTQHLLVAGGSPFGP
jgi:Zn-dependent protease